MTKDDKILLINHITELWETFENLDDKILSNHIWFVVVMKKEQDKC